MPKQFPTVTNRKRASTANGALRKFQMLAGMKSGAQTQAEILTDFLGNVRHWCDLNDVDYAACDRNAYLHYTEEKAEG
ncbi:MAG: hypothetical protein WDM91_10795 [Rhizomicrobium sp.]